MSIDKFILSDGTIFPFPDAERLGYVQAFKRTFPDCADNIDLPPFAFARALPFLRDFDSDPDRVLAELRRDSTLFGDALLTAHCLEHEEMGDALVRSFKTAHEYDNDAELRLALHKY